MGQRIKEESRIVALESAAVALQAQMKVLDQHQCWIASAYLNQAIEALKGELLKAQPFISQGNTTATLPY